MGECQLLYQIDERFEVSYFLVQEFLIQPLSGKIRVQMVWAVACEENISAVEDDWLG